MKKFIFENEKKGISMKLLFNYKRYLDVLKTLDMEKFDIPGIVVVPSQKNWLTPRGQWQISGSKKEKKIAGEYFPSANLIVVYLDRIGSPDHFVQVLLHECRHAYQYNKAGLFKLWKIRRDVDRGTKDGDYYLHDSWTENDARQWADDNLDKFMDLFSEMDENENAEA